MLPRLSRSLLLLTVFVTATASVVAAPTERNDTAFFENKIRPILVENCYKCHSEEAGEQKGGLLLDRESGWLDGGNLGKAVIPGNLNGSLLITAVRYEDEDLEMPPKHQLSEEEVRLLEIWVKRGAPGPKVDLAESEFSRLGDQEYIFEQAKSHWAFQPLDPVQPPKTSPKLPEEAGWRPLNNPVDQFIIAKLEEEGLTPTRRADRRMLIRRLYFSLTGLPPSEEQVAEFVENRDMSPNAVINELMESHYFGEHFARMWLDVARYADTANRYRFDTKTPIYYPYAFTYRDYVIKAFNSDKPYDQFIREQLAADLFIEDEHAPELAALGFLGVSPITNSNQDFVDDLIDTTTRGMMGLTVSCARCHDHKFEPVPTADYYSLYGVFASMKRPEAWDVSELPEIEGYPRDPKLVAEYEAKRAEIDALIKEVGNKKQGNNSIAERIRETRLAELYLYHDGAPAYAMLLPENPNPFRPQVYLRGDRSNRGEKVERQFLRLLDPEQKPFSAENSGRLDLAEHIADPENPLTARVFVNRVWGMLMGSYIVDTPSDFGLQGAAPTHPELLDWLAADFVAHDWSVKHLVRTIVTSQTWQQASGSRTPNPSYEKDPENRFYWQGNRQRMEIEELRDSMLAVSGELDSTSLGRPGELWGDEATQRRSIYGFIDRFNLDPTLRSFGFPSPTQTQGKRPENTVPQQALFKMNSPFVRDRAQATMLSLGFSGAQGRQERVDALFQRILQREPHPVEYERISDFIDREKDRPGNPWVLVAQSLLMSNEFQYVD